ncbi:uncharacterized protein LOC130666360 [Microplitis mediator]|uniref:uncharacterized protein LOC130666360 n=1 Tax=Microplitis mediator TaxID=375433 RepID=UPI0025540FC0|nr:uncharacterized protein LOC130666360 [Microplitis mediator]
MMKISNTVKLLLAFCALALLCYVLFPKSPIDESSYDHKYKVELALINPKLMTLSNHQEIFNEYQTESYLQTFNKHFMEGDVPKVGKIASFGIAVLAKYAEDDHLKEYLRVAEDLIRKINGQLGAIKIGSDQKVPWGGNWFDFSVLLTRMLAMYEYLGEDKEVKTICGRRIIEIIPELNKSLGWTRSDFEFVYIAIPRLMTNYLNDRKLYDSELEDQKGLFGSLSKVFNLTYNTEDDGKDGLYRDGSYLYHSVATYSYLASLGNFYGTVYRALGFDANIDAKVIELFDKILHPDMDFIPYGLFGREPKITCTDILKYYWPKYRKDAKLGVNIFPYIGLGVFKSSKFVFSLRVQRPDIAAYESDPDNFEFPAGWIQMRKLYLKGVDYSEYKNEMKWPELELQPGVISFVDDEYNKFENLKPVTGSLAHLYQGARSYIGHLADDDKNLLFWINNYKFDKIYGDSEVMEYGICTDNGLVMRYSVDNKLGGRELKLRVKDDDIKDDSRMHITTVPELDENGCFVFRSSERYFWRQVFDINVEPTTIYIDSINGISFQFNKKHFEIRLSDDKCHYTIKRGPNLILAGGWHSDPNKTYELNGKNFIRNPDTMMYELVE